MAVTDTNELIYRIDYDVPQTSYAGRAGTCAGCMHDPTYPELIKGAICNTKGCDGKSKWKSRKTRMGKYQKNVK